MKVKSSIESFNDTNKVPETFSFSEKENEKQILNKDFVFKFEDNTKQLGTDANNASTGEEENSDNHVEEHIEKKREEQEHKEEEKIREQVSETSTTTTTTTSTTAASSATATVSTIAATTTAAVVLVVGGGIALGQTLEKPKICQFNDVVAVENNINFTLSLGNDQLKIDNGEENTECDVIIELTCPSMEDFYDEIPVKQFGKIEGEFKDLEYDTEYLLNVSQHVMLGAGSEYISDTPYSITTPKKAEALVDGLTFTKGYDPLGSDVYYAQFTYTQEIPEYMYAYIGLVDAELFDGSENVDWINFSDFNPRSSEKQRLSFNTEVYPGEMVAAILLEGENQSSDMGEYSRWILYSVQLDFSTLEETEGLINEEGFYFKRHTTNSVLDYFDVYVSYFGDVSEYQYFELKATHYSQYEGDETVDVFTTRLTEGINTADTINAIPEQYESYTWGTLTIMLYGVNPNSPSQSETSLMTREMDFSRVPIVDNYVPTHPTYYDTTFYPYVSYSGCRYLVVMNIDYYDPDQMWTQMFEFEFVSNDDTPNTITLMAKPCPYYGLTNYYYFPDLTTDQYYELARDEAYTYTITQTGSSHPDDSGSIYVCASDIVLTGLANVNAEYVPVGVTTYNDNLYATFTLQEFSGYEEFDSFTVILTRISDSSTTETVNNVEIGVETPTRCPVELTDQEYSVEIYGFINGDSTLLFEEVITYFGVS